MQPKFFGKAVAINLILMATLMVGVLGLMSGCGKSSESTTSEPKVTETRLQPTSTTTGDTQVNAPVTPTTADPALSAKTAVATVTGNSEKVYQTSCRVCHDTGNLGSPRIGDKAAWKDRIAQGNEVLYTHAIQGFTGKSGVMPPKGTSTAPDVDIKSAVDYIVAKSQ